MRFVAWLGLLALILTACAPLVSTPMPTDAVPTPTPSGSGTGSRALLPEESPPSGAEREFSTDFSRHSVPYSEILSGGPPKDGIPAIDAPKFISVEEADEWLQPQEPVVLVQVGDDARAYPIQILMWHEIVNDTIGEAPVVVTYCPLCNTGVAFERTFDGQVLDFGTTGRLRYSNLIMYDRQTETWWQQATGEGIVGEYALRQLTFVPASMISWEDFRETYPDGQVLSRDTGYNRDYGRNPYIGYDLDQSPFLFRGPETPDVLHPMARVLTVDLNGEAVGYSYEVLQEVHVVNDLVGGVPIVVLWAPGTASALNSATVADGDDVGAGTTYSRELDGETLTFVFDGERILDEQSGSEWDVLGKAVSGPKAGSQLEPVVSINHFWFSWAAFRPDTRIYGVDNEETPEATPTEPEAVSDALLPDFEIEVYQGEAVLGGQTVRFSEVLAQGKPIVLNFWAGLCPICRAELPGLQAAYEEYGDRVIMLGVDIGTFVRLGSEEDALALLDELDITYPAGKTSEASILPDYRILGTPTTLFITPDGEVIRRRHGIFTEDQVVSFIETLLEASGSS